LETSFISSLEVLAVKAKHGMGHVLAFEQATAGRTLLLSRTIRVKNTGEEARTFIHSTGARVAEAGTEAEAKNLQGSANSMRRKLQTNDARIATYAKREGIRVITNDERFNRFLNAAGIGGEKY